eukprot:361870_1
MAFVRSTKLMQRNVARLQSIGIRNTWIIVKNNSGKQMRADVTWSDQTTNTQCRMIYPGKENSWPFPIGQYKVWLTDTEHSTAWFLLNKTNERDCIIDVGDHIHYHLENATEEALPHVLP